MSLPNTPTGKDWELVYESKVYREFLAERDEVLRYKWLQSERAGHDIGFDKALMQWITLHRSCWLEQRRREMGTIRATDLVVRAAEPRAECTVAERERGARQRDQERTTKFRGGFIATPAGVRRCGLYSRPRREQTDGLQSRERRGNSAADREGNTQSF